MNKLFIIGNGFDLAHKIPSSYRNFHQYLVYKLNSIAGNKYENYDFTDSEILSNDYETSPENDLLTILYFLSIAEYFGSYDKDKGTFDEKRVKEWKDIEKSVGELNYDDFSWIYIDESDEDKEYRANWINEDIFSPYIEVLKSIPNYFEEWIKQLRISNIILHQDIKQYFDVNTFFLCFNYTNTLEKIYNIDKKHICYIHGNVDREEKIYFGHGNGKTYSDYLDSIKNLNYFSVAEGYSEINDALRKPVKEIICKNKDFFKSLNNIQQVYSYGFSYGIVDLPYIKEICKNASNITEWYINSYPPENEKQCYKKYIKKCGYEGIIKEFS